MYDIRIDGELISKNQGITAAGQLLSTLNLCVGFLHVDFSRLDLKFINDETGNQVTISCLNLNALGALLARISTVIAQT